MAEAPDAQFVAEDAVYIYHKKFMVCDNSDEGSIDDDEVYHLWRQNHPNAKCDVFQENWFHDCDNEHAKITAFSRQWMCKENMRKKLPLISEWNELLHFHFLGKRKVLQSTK